MFEDHSADTGAGKFPLVSMGGRAEDLACTDPGARTPIGASRIYHISSPYQPRPFLNFFLLLLSLSLFIFNEHDLRGRPPESRAPADICPDTIENWQAHLSIS
jgi:hypothetical protein